MGKTEAAKVAEKLKQENTQKKHLRRTLYSLAGPTARASFTQGGKRNRGRDDDGPARKRRRSTGKRKQVEPKFDEKKQRFRFPGGQTTVQKCGGYDAAKNAALKQIAEMQREAQQKRGEKRVRKLAESDAKAAE